MTTLARSFFGYRRDDVRITIRGLEERLENSSRELSEARDQIAKLEATVEEQRLTMSLLRRQRTQLLDTPGPLQAVEIWIGPTEDFEILTPLVQDIETMSQLNLQFRMYQDQFYRIEAMAPEKANFVEWLRTRSEVETVHVDGTQIQVTLRR